MARLRKFTSPGCVFERNNKLYLKIGNRQYSTGLNNTSEGKILANEMKDKMYSDMLQQQGLIDRGGSISIYDAYAEFLQELKRQRYNKRI